MKKTSLFWKRRITFLLAAALLAGEISGATLTASATGTVAQEAETEKVEKTVPIPEEYISLNGEEEIDAPEEMAPETATANQENSQKADETIPVIKLADENAISDQVNAEKAVSDKENQSVENTMPQNTMPDTIPVIEEVEENMVPVADKAIVTTPAAITADMDAANEITVGSVISRDAATNGTGSQTEDFTFTPEESGYYGMILRKSYGANVYSLLTNEYGMTGISLFSFDNYLDSAVFYLEANQNYTWSLQYNFYLYDENGSFECEIVKVDELAVGENAIEGSAGEISAFDYNTQLGLLQITLDSEKGYDYFLSINETTVKLTNGQPTSVFMMVSGNMTYTLWKNSTEVDNVKLTINTAEVAKGEEEKISTLSVSSSQAPNGNYNGYAILSFTPEEEGYYAFVSDLDISRCSGYAQVYEYVSIDNSACLTSGFGSSSGNENVSVMSHLEAGKTYYYCVSLSSYNEKTYAEEAQVYIKAVNPQNISLNQATEITVDGAALYKTSVEKGKFYEISLTGTNGNTYQVGINNSSYSMRSFAKGLNLFTKEDDKVIVYCSADSTVELDIFGINNLATSKIVTLEIKEYDADKLTLNQLTSNQEKLSINNTLIKKFTPTESGNYSFFGMNYTGSGYWDQIGVSIIGEDGNLQEVFTPTLYYLEFDVQCQLEAGKTYYLINNTSGSHEAEAGDYVVGVTKAETYDVSFAQGETETISNISMYKSANVKFTVPERGFYQLEVNGEVDSYQLDFNGTGYVLYSGIGKLFYFDNAGEYTLHLSREVTKESSLDEVSLTVRKGGGLLTLKELVSNEEQNKVDFTFVDYDDYKWGEFTPAETGTYVIFTSYGVGTNLYQENADGGYLEQKAFLLNSSAGGNNKVVTLEKDKHYYLKLMPGLVGDELSVRIISVPTESVSGNSVTVTMDTNHGVLVNYQAEKEGIYKIGVNGEKENYEKYSSQSAYISYDYGEDYFFCSKGSNTFYICQNVDSYEVDTVTIDISNVSTEGISKEITMTDKTLWVKYSPEASGKYTWGTLGALEDDSELYAELYVQTSQSHLSYVDYLTTPEGEEFSHSVTLEKGYNYYLKIISDTVPNTFEMYVVGDQTAQMNLAEETEIELQKTAWAELDVANMKAGFYKVSISDTNENKYITGFDTTLYTGRGSITTPQKDECTIYLSSTVIKKAKKAKKPITVQITRFGAPASGKVKVQVSGIEVQEQALALNEQIEAEGTTAFDCYSFTPDSTGYYRIKLNGINRFYFENNGKIKLYSKNKKISLGGGITYKFYVENTESVPYSICIRQEKTVRVYDYDSYQAFIASGGTITLMNSSDISDDVWDEYWNSEYEEDGSYTSNYRLNYIGDSKYIVLSTKDFKDTNHKWFLDYSDSLTLYAPIKDYAQICEKLTKQKYVGMSTDIVPEDYIYKNLCDKNGNLISADTNADNPYIVFAKYGPEYVLIQNIKLQGVNALKPGETATLKANISTGNKLAPTDPSVTWTSSDNSIVTVDNQGNMKGLKAGTATITCTANDQLHRSDSLKVTVTENVVYAAKVTITGSNSVDVGESITLKATIDTNGKGKPSRDGVFWTSSDTSVAIVDENGVVTGIKAGTVVITARTMDGKAKADYKITVKNVEAKKIALNESKITMKYGTTYKWLKVTFTPKNTTNKKLTWKSSNTKVATVTSSGKIKAKGVGEATITVKSSNGKKDTLKVTVSKYDIKTKKVKLPSKETLQEGDKITLSLEFTPVNATNQKVNWESSDESVATVNSKGVVTAKKAGKTTITVTTKDGTKKTAKCKITVKELGQVKELKAVSDSKGTAKLTWKEVEGADGYRIYMATSKKGNYKKIGTTKAGTLTFTKKTLTGKKKYYFKVVAFRKSNGKQYEGKYSAVKSVTVKK